MLTKEALKSYLLDMPRGHVFDLTYVQFAEIFPPGEPDAAAREGLRRFAVECGCDLNNNPGECRFELARR